jgi:UBA-like domain
MDEAVRNQQLLTTPLPAGRDPSRSQINYRLNALHLRIGPWVGVNRATLKGLLQEAGWDFEEAIKLWRIHLALRITHHVTGSFGRTSEEVLEDELLSASSLHQNHRLGINRLYGILGLEMLRTVPNASRRYELTSLRVALLLREANWDIGVAQDRGLEMVNNDEERRRFFRRERRLRLVMNNNLNQLHQDERVALFMEIAGTDDYTSAEHFLRSHGWDLGVAMDDWMRHGLPMVRYDRAELRKVLFAVPLQFHTESENLWPSSRPTAQTLSGVDQADRIENRENYLEGSYNKRKGWMINQDDIHPLLGLRQPEKMRVDTIINGKFKALRYNKRPRGESKQNAKGEHVRGTREIFDWCKKDHLNKLVIWRRQPPRRTTGVLKRVKAKEYCPAEDDWIHDWHKAQRDAMLNGESVDDYRSRGGKWPLKYDTNKLFKEYNEEFEGRTDLPGTDGEPRSKRTKAGLDARRKRIKRVCDTFGLKLSPPHPKKTNAKSDSKDNATETNDKTTEGPGEQSNVEEGAQVEEEGEEYDVEEDDQLEEVDELDGDDGLEEEEFDAEDEGDDSDQD